VLLKGHLYGTSPNSLVCVEFPTGKVVWKEPKVSASSILFADGRLYLHGEDGQVVMAEANPEKYVEKGRFTPPGRPAAVNRGDKAWAYPALAVGKLYIREHGVLWCYDVKGN
jgi:outer membrane protein assembly factor BamB